MNKLNLLALAMSTAVALSGCATEGGDGAQATDQQALTSDPNVAAPSPKGDDDRARQIAQVKLAQLARQGIVIDEITNAIAPDSAACGRNGPTANPVRTNDAADAARIRTGSSTSCAAVGQLNAGDDANYFCFTTAGDFTWTFLEDIQTGKRGWTRDDLLRNDGSFTFCGF